MCDYTQVEYRCAHQRVTVRAWCTKYRDTHKRCPARIVAIEYRMHEDCGKLFSFRPSNHPFQSTSSSRNSHSFTDIFPSPQQYPNQYLLPGEFSSPF
ncbi:hypothetical protein K470DRAFT_248002 [Piedraia hortae CBS 480.64]|uniref:Uncharacterized protein n=1 Tax=Piedraia hortae CBS 480.64 TaxID=1314780 RepID=A0A6A7BXY5_9PEZI|nr:hypothetical protein K470DRAFT_248002 [Piedraia hortae CBS 480.64]